jgi:hypothetical protein
MSDSGWETLTRQAEEGDERTAPELADLAADR